MSSRKPSWKCLSRPPRQRPHHRHDRVAGHPHVPGERHARRVEPGRHPGHRHRAVEVVARVLFARPYAPSPAARPAGRSCTASDTKSCIAPRRPKPPPSMRLCTTTLRARHAGRLGGGRERRLAVLRGRPDLDLVAGDVGGAVLRLHAWRGRGTAPRTRPRRAWRPAPGRPRRRPPCARRRRRSAASPLRRNRWMLALDDLAVAAVVPDDGRAPRAPSSPATSCRRPPRPRRPA